MERFLTDFLKMCLCTCYSNLFAYKILFHVGITVEMLPYNIQNRYFI